MTSKDFSVKYIKLPSEKKAKKEKENNLNFEKEFNNALSFERNRQLNQFSKIYFSKIKNNINIDEK